jgi:hypothetical protein
MKLEFMNEAPPGSIYDCHASGWIQTDLFKQSFRHFVQHVNPAEAELVLFMLDGNYSHTRSLDITNFFLRASCFCNIPSTASDAQDVAY